MNRTIIAISVIFFLMLSCAKKETLISQTKPVSNIETFFATYEKDLKNTARVIIEKELIKNLTHLQRMNNGGDRYYLLERESLTSMIQELYSYTYDETILTNSSGTIIYTMYEDKLLSKSALSFSKNIGIVFAEAKKGQQFILDVCEFPDLSGNFLLFFGYPVMNGTTCEGVLITALNARKVREITKIGLCAFDSQGIIRIHIDPLKILKPSSVYGKIATAREELPNGVTRFSYRSIEWFIIDSE